MNNLKERCAEILEWQRSGVLKGNALRNFAEAQWYANEHNSLQMAEADTAREAYAAVVQQVGWIPVTESLPSESQGTVAVLTAEGDILTAWASYWSGARDDFACWTFPHDEDAEAVVTHWAPLQPVKP